MGESNDSHRLLMAKKFQSTVAYRNPLPYSGKFSLVQNFTGAKFTELLVNPSEENLGVNLRVFMSSINQPRPGHHFTAHSKFRGSYFRGSQPICEKREICIVRKFPAIWYIKIHNRQINDVGS